MEKAPIDAALAGRATRQPEGSALDARSRLEIAG
jgi:hypothetical protein